MEKKPVIAGAIAFLLFSLILCQAASATPWTPVEWKESGKLQDWIRDRNHDYVDDLIDRETGQITIIVDLNQCVINGEKSDIIRYLESVGTIRYVGEYLSFIIVGDVDVGSVPAIAARPDVAMVELATPGIWTQANAQAAKIEAGFYTPQTLQDRYQWRGLLNGTGVIIAFADTGVSTATETMYGISVAGGYDGFTSAAGNPQPTVTDDAQYHADWMTSWVFPAWGISPGARLFDIKIGSMQDGVDATAEMRAFEAIYANNNAWNINILTLMYSATAPTDGKDARSQLLNLLSSKGIVVVAGTGDNAAGTDVTYPGVASQVIGIAAADIRSTVDRSDDTAPFIVGPVVGGAAGRLESLKPELLIPTGESGTPASNSIATAQAAGLSALVLQFNPDLRDPGNKAAGSVKDLLLRSAEAKGTADTTLSYPQSSPSWDTQWGYGEVDAFNAIQHLSGTEQAGRADLTFVGFDGSSHPSSPWYYSHAVETQSERNGVNIQAGAGDRIFARIQNNGPQAVSSVRVNFGFYPFTAGIPKFYDIGSQIIPDLGPGNTTDVSIDWIPPDMPEGEDHGCLLVTIDYGYDTRYAGGSNFAQKNVRVASTGSPAVFTFRVENPLTSRARIHLDATTDATAWKVTLSENNFDMDPRDCARSITATVVPPGGLNPGTEALFFITAYATERGTDRPVDIGGVALKARVGGAVIPDVTIIVIIVVIVAIIFGVWYWLSRKRRKKPVVKPSR
ncbi:hypothetical protein ASZ90_015461 [hydrocarbon metagenome]|uniref:Peptidase S8/S53 domain-containing protein n=1 Tax=hydrocarbon metagenome TaxID=938273 RepID=A0A0W8F1W4_9ZZZZ